MAVPAKPQKEIDDFLDGAATEKGNNQPPKDKHLIVLMPAELHATIKRNANGSIKFFTQKIFREYFEKKGIEIKL